MNPVESSTGASRGAFAILGSAFELYRAHAKVFLTAAAIGLVPIYLLHALLTASLVPSQETSRRVDARSERMEARTKLLERHAKDGTLDSAEAERAQKEMMEDLGATLADAGKGAASAGVFLLSMLFLVPLSILGTFLGTAALIPLVDDRSRGGAMTPGAAWSLVGAHAVPLVVTSFIAMVAVGIGLFLLVLPGVVLGFLFAFAAPVVMLEDRGGIAALKTSAKLVLANLVPTAVVMIALGLLTGVAHLIGGLFIPGSWVFMKTLASDLVSLVVFPLPIIGLVLLYRDARRSAPSPQPQLATR